MQLQRNEIMTGLLVIATIAVVAFVLVLLGAPGLFRPLVTYKIYFDNAAGIKQGAPVMLAGRKIGQVQKLFSPVSSEEEKRAQAAAAAVRPPEPHASPTPSDGRPKFEARVEVQVDKSARVYRDARASCCSSDCSATWLSTSPREPKVPAAQKMARCSRENAHPI